jgi:hypothetical protein
MGIPIYLEAGSKRVFACTLDWPGWCRLGKSEQDALQILASYRDRYAAVAAEAGIDLPAADFDVVEKLSGSMTTDFGAPAAIPTSDRRPLTTTHADRLLALLGGCWTIFNRVVASSPRELRKGPRGGGRDRDKMVDHVLGAETGYARKVGVQSPAPNRDDSTAIVTFRGQLTDTLRRAVGETSSSDNRWPAPYVIRRIAWHVMDHAWEMEDRRV